MRQAALTLTILVLLGVAGFCGAARSAGGAPASLPSVELTYTSRAALARVLRELPVHLVRVVAPLHVAEVRPSEPIAVFLRTAAKLPGVAAARATVARTSAGSATGQDAPAVPARGWSYSAVGLDHVPPSVLAAAKQVTIAVVDSGAEVASPALADKLRGTYNVLTGRRRVRDRNGHGTFVASIAGGANRRGSIVGFGGAARLLIVKVSNTTSFSDVAVAAGIIYAVRHGARIINLSVAGRAPSIVEKAALEYAARRGVLAVAAAGNDALGGDPPEYPAALLQPVGSKGIGGLGISVGASDTNGSRAPFSEYGSYVSLVAPGESVFGARGRDSYGYASGTSFAAPEVAGVAALVWAADRKLTFRQVAKILKRTASGGGAWTPELGFGVLDAQAAVESALTAAASDGR